MASLRVLCCRKTVLREVRGPRRGGRRGKQALWNGIVGSNVPQVVE